MRRTTLPSPGLAFVLATIAEYGEDGWTDYWTRLRANGLQVVDSWEDAYYGAFSGAGDGDKPLVVSYGSSPPVEVVFADPPIEAATTELIKKKMLPEGTKVPLAVGKKVLPLANFHTERWTSFPSTVMQEQLFEVVSNTVTLTPVVSK